MISAMRGATGGSSPMREIMMLVLVAIMALALMGYLVDPLAGVQSAS